MWHSTALAYSSLGMMNTTVNMEDVAVLLRADAVDTVVAKT